MSCSAPPFLRALLGALVVAVCCVAALSPSPAAARASAATAKARTAVVKHLARTGVTGSPVVRCARRPVSGRRRCTWSGARRRGRTIERCMGTVTARRTGRGVKVGRDRRRCRPPAPLAAMPGAPFVAPAGTPSPVAPGMPSAATAAPAPARTAPDGRDAAPTDEASIGTPPVEAGGEPLPGDAGTPDAPPTEETGTATPPVLPEGDPEPGDPAPVEPDPGDEAEPDAPHLRYFGFNDNAVRARQTDAPTDARLTEDVGANLTRLTFDWRWVERSPHAYDFREYDAIYAAARARGIRPLWIVMYAPRWAVDPADPCGSDCRLPPADAHLAAWQRLISGIALRYPESAGIEVWNEPNLRTFWHSGPDPERYGRLLASARRGLDDVSSPLPLVGASVSNNEATLNGNLSLSDFLTGVYASGAGRSMDAISVHPYPWALDTSETGLLKRSLRRVRQIRDAADDAGKPIWVTETGLSTTGSTPRHVFSEPAQADGLVSQYRELAAQPDIEAIAFHTLIEPPGESWSINPGYGIVRGDLTPKPAYCALKLERTGTGC